MHLSFNSRRPWRTKIGSFEWQWVAAYLEEINPAYRGLAENYLGYGKGQSQDEKRYFNGAMLLNYYYGIMVLIDWPRPLIGI